MRIHLNKAVRRVLGVASRARDDRRGNVAPIFALVLVPIMGIIGASIDYGRALNTKSLLTNAADAALSGVTPKIGLVEASELRKSVRAALDANLPERLQGLPFEMSVNKDNGYASMSMQTSVPTSLLGLIGFAELKVDVASKVHQPKVRQAPATRRMTPARQNLDALARGLANQSPPRGKQPSAEETEAMRQALSDPRMQRAIENLEARMRDAISRAR